MDNPPTDGTRWPFEGFCILKYDFDDTFQKEFDFAKFDQKWSPAAIAHNQKYLFVANGRMIKKISKDNEQVFDITIPAGEPNPGLSISVNDR